MASKPKISTSSPVDRLAALTAERDRLREQCDLIHAAPRSLDEARADVSKVVEQLAERLDLPVGYLAGGPTGHADLAHVMGANLPDWPQLAPMAVLAWCAPQQLAAALERDLERLYEGLPTPMSGAAKADELLKLNRQIAEIEARISSEWWAASDLGMAPPVPDVSGPTLVGLAPE